MSSNRKFKKDGEIEDLFKAPDPGFVNLFDRGVFEQDQSLELFDSDNPDVSLFDSVDGELVSVGGIDISLYKWHGSSRYDELYEEERVRLLSPKPVIVRGVFDLEPIQENLEEFGLELTHDNLFIFNRSDIRKQLGRSPVPGDLLRPAFSNIMYEVYEVQETDFEIYGVYHLAVSTKVWRDTDTFRKLRQTSDIDSQLLIVEGSPMVEQTLLLTMSDGYQHLIDVKYVDDTLYNIRLGFEDGSHVPLDPSSLRKPVMMVPHGGPSQRKGSGGAARNWSTRGFFSIAMDIRGRGESAADLNSAFAYGRVLEDGLRDRLDCHEMLQLLRKQDYRVFVRYDRPDIPYETIITAEPAADDPIPDHFDPDLGLCSEGFSLGGGFTMFNAGDSENGIPLDAYSITTNHGRNKGDFWINPETGKRYHEDYRAGIGPKDRFPKFTAMIGGGAYCDADLHMQKKNNEFARLHYLSFRFQNQHFWGFLGWRQYMRSLGGKSGRLFDWKAQRKPKGIHVDMDIQFLYDFLMFSGTQPLYFENLEHLWQPPPQGEHIFFHGDPLSQFIPQGGGYDLMRKCRHGESIELTTPNTWFPYDTLDFIPWNTYKVMNMGPFRENRKMMEFFDIETPEDTAVTFKNLGRNFTDKFGPDRFSRSSTPCFWYMGYDDIWMDPGDDIENFVNRMTGSNLSELPIAQQDSGPPETYYHCTHGGVHGVSNAVRKDYGANGTLNFIEHHVFGIPYDTNYGFGSKDRIWMDVVPNTVTDFQRTKYVSEVVKLNSWPPPRTETIEISLVDADVLMNDGSGVALPPPETDEFDRIDPPDDPGEVSPDEEPMSGSSPGGPGEVDPRGIVDPEPHPDDYSPSLDYRLKEIRTVAPGEYSTWSLSAIQNIFLRGYPNLPQPNEMAFNALGFDEGYFGSSVMEYRGPTLDESKLLLGYVEVDMTVSAWGQIPGTFQVVVNLWEEKASGERRYVTGGSWTTRDYLTGEGPIISKKFNLDLYCYEFEEGSTLIVRVQNITQKQPPYEERTITTSDGNQEPDMSQFSIGGGVFSTMPLFSDFSFKVKTTSKVSIPINNQIPKSPLYEGDLSKLLIL